MHEFIAHTKLNHFPSVAHYLSSVEFYYGTGESRPTNMGPLNLCRF